MDLTHLTSQLKVKTDFNANSSLGLSNINGITGIVDNSVSSLQALIFSNRSAEYDDLDVTNFDLTGIKSGYDSKCFIFDLKKDYKLNLSSDITDHYVESNVAIQDHIGLRPIIIEVSGCIGEKRLLGGTLFTKLMAQYENPRYEQQSEEGKNIFNSIDSYLGRMGSLTSFAPNIVNQSLNVYNTAKYVYATTNKVINLDKKDNSGKSGYDYTEAYTEETIQDSEQFDKINWFKIQWWNRASFSIVTPYGVFNNMYIVELNAVQPENTRYVTNLNIRFKQIRKATVIKTRKKAAQKVETQQEKKIEDIDYTTDIQKITKKAIQDVIAQPPANTGDVTQVTQQEFDKYEAMVKTLNVPPAQGIISQPNILMNAAMRGVQGTMPPPIIGGGVI